MGSPPSKGLTKLNPDADVGCFTLFVTMLRLAMTIVLIDARSRRHTSSIALKFNLGHLPAFCFYVEKLNRMTWKAKSLYELFF